MRLCSFLLHDRPTWGVVAADGTLIDARGVDGAPATLDDLKPETNETRDMLADLLRA